MTVPHLATLAVLLAGIASGLAALTPIARDRCHCGQHHTPQEHR